jgi:hypothetical protein
MAQPIILRYTGGRCSGGCIRHQTTRKKKNTIKINSDCDGTTRVVDALAVEEVHQGWFASGGRTDNSEASDTNKWYV